MQIQYLFFLLYIIACFWLFPRLRFIKDTGLSTGELRLLLAIKMASSLVIAMHLSTLPNSDYLSYNNAGSLQYQLLKSDPLAFFTDFGDVDQNAGLKDLFASSYSFWADMRSSLLYKIIALFSLFTGGNFYLNSILFSSVVFFGHVAFYKIFRELYPDKKWLLVASCFLLPSLLMYTSSVHKDGFVFLSMAAICYVFHSFLSRQRFPGLSHILVIILAVITIFMFRNYVLVAMLPAMFAVFLCQILPVKRRVVLPISYGIYLLLFFLSGSVSPALNLPEAVIKRKADFALLQKGNTTIPMNDLHPNAGSFLSNIPQAINHTLMRPYLWESSQPGVLMVAMELLLYQILFLLFLFYRYKKRGPIHNFNVLGILFFLSMMLIIGYTIPNVGAIVRYRSIFWILVLCPIACNINWEKFLSLVGYKSKPSL